MLNESYRLSQAFKEAGLSMRASHPSIKVPGMATGPAIRVCLGADGSIVRCETVVKDNWPGLWAHFDGNHNSFPVIRLAQPLMAISEAMRAPEDESKGKKKALCSAERRKALMETLTLAQPALLKDETINLFVRLRDKAEMLAQICEGKSDDIVHVCRAYNLIVPREAKKERVAQPVPLLDALREWAQQRLPVCEDSELDALEVLLFSASGDKGKKKAQIALDIDDPMATIYRSEAERRVTAEFLQKEAAGKEAASIDGETPRSPVCAFTGSSDLWTRSFPPVRLPALRRDFAIFSMFSEAECNLRYGLKDSEIVPVAKHVVLKMQDSLNEIMTPEREGKTWRKIASEKPGSKREAAIYDQFIAYVDGKPEINAETANLFGTSEDDTERQFEADAAVLCDALDAVQRDKPGSRLNLFVLRKASEGQALVALAETPTVEEVLDGSHWWQAASRNVPLGMPYDAYGISLPLFNRKEKRPEPTKPSVPYPGQVVRLLTEGWLEKRGGAKDEPSKQRVNKLRGAAFSEVLDMMLQRPGKADTAAEHILSLCLDHTGSLLCGLAECQTRQTKKDWEAYGDKERRTALRAVSTIGITLYALGSKKEDYMHEAAFQVGQILALADRLHRCYCMVVRDGSMPPSLIGNAHFSAALDNPERALAVLAERFRIYQGWAEAVKPEAYPESADKEKHIAVLEAKKVLRLYRPLASDLHSQGLPQDCDDVVKAHMLLGYLAGEETGGQNK